jgi:hypothetical protein
MNSVTEPQVMDIFVKSKFDVKTIFKKCTVVTCQLPNGFIIVESSACVDPENYDEKLGYDICRERIINKIWELEGYKLQSELSTI